MVEKWSRLEFETEDGPCMVWDFPVEVVFGDDTCPDGIIDLVAKVLDCEAHGVKWVARSVDMERGSDGEVERRNRVTLGNYEEDNHETHD